MIIHKELAKRSVLLLSAVARNGRHCWRHLANFAEGRAAEETHATSTMVTWRRVSVFVALPVVGYLTWKHVIVGEEHHEGREYFPWPHLRIRNKPFPWRDSDKTLFHNPQTNPGPEPEEEKQMTEPTSVVAQLWMEYLFEDPVKRDQFRWNHLARMQKRREDYLAKKSKGEEPIQPMDLVAEVKVTPVNPVHSGIDN